MEYLFFYRLIIVDSELKRSSAGLTIKKINKINKEQPENKLFQWKKLYIRHSRAEV